MRRKRKSRLTCGLPSGSAIAATIHEWARGNLVEVSE